jgi:predicted enzyme related to lactoylglutathione lyase
MSRKGITGLGGIFFKSKDPKASMDWYSKNLGLTVDENYGASFLWRSDQNPEKAAYSVWSPFKETTKYFEPAQVPFMINFRVENLVELLHDLKANGIEQVGEMQEFEYGKFAWIIDPDGVKIELWEPADQSYGDMCGDKIHRT